MDESGEERELTIAELINRLDKRYGPGANADTFRAQLKNRRRGKGESLRELGEATRELVAQAYPEASHIMQERLAKDHFREALEDGELRAAIHRARPTTLDAAMEAAMEEEQYIQMEMRRGGRSGRMMGTVQREIDDQVPYPVDQPTSAFVQSPPSVPVRPPPSVLVRPPPFAHVGPPPSAPVGPPPSAPIGPPPFASIGPFGPAPSAPVGPPQSASVRPPIRCYNCNELGHMKRRCPYPLVPPRLQCFYCRGWGHTQHQCPYVPQMSGNEQRPSWRSEGRPGPMGPAPQK
jgi:hypothetical protein